MRKKPDLTGLEGDVNGVLYGRGCQPPAIKPEPVPVQLDFRDAEIELARLILKSTDPMLEEVRQAIDRGERPASYFLNPEDSLRKLGLKSNP